MRLMIDRLLRHVGVIGPDETAELEWIGFPAANTRQARELGVELRATLAELSPERVLTMGAFALMGVRADARKPSIMNERGRMQWVDHDAGRWLLVPTIQASQVHADPEFYRDLARDVMKWATQDAPVDFEYPDFYLPSTVAELRARLGELGDHAVLALDVETTGFDPRRDELLCLGVAAATGPALVVDKALLAVPEAQDALWDALWADPLTRVVLHNGKFDLKFLAGLWGAIPQHGDGARLGDTMLLSHLLDERPVRSKYTAHGLKALARVRFDVPDYGFDHETFQARYRGDEGAAPLTQDDWDEFYAYQAMDVRVTARLWNDLVREAADESTGLLRVHDELLMPATSALAEAEYRGLPVDLEYLADERRRLERRIDRRDRALRSFLTRYDGGQPGDDTDNITAPAKFVAIVMDRFGVLPSKTKGFRSISEAGLAQYAKYKFDATGRGRLARDDSPIHWPNVGDKKAAQRGKYTKPMTPTDIGDMRALIISLMDHGRRHEARWIAAVLEQRLDQKYLSTYIAGFEKGLGPDGRVHAEFNLGGTVTGRLSSSNPNLHAIPKRGQLTPFRKVIAASPGWSLIEADYSQLELRVAAMLSGDEALTKTYAEGRDLHLEVASLMLSKPPEKISEPERYLAKAVDFGVIYGRSAQAIAKGDAMFYFSQVLGGGEPWTVEETDAFIKRFLDGYPKLRDWITDTERQVLETRIVETPFGRRRRFIILDRVPKDAVPWKAGHPMKWPGVPASIRTILRQGVNTPIQSLASDICLSAFARLTRELDPAVARTVSSVHDSILVEARDDVVAETAATMKRIMEDSPVDTRGVPLGVDVKIGRSLADEDMLKWQPSDEREHASDDKDPMRGSWETALPNNSKGRRS
jgi:DNA polymerase-1